jgi:hypothetical protein
MIPASAALNLGELLLQYLQVRRSAREFEGGRGPSVRRLAQRPVER